MFEEWKFKRTFRKGVRRGGFSDDEIVRLQSCNISEEFRSQFCNREYAEQTAHIKKQIERTRRCSAEQEQELTSIAEIMGINITMSRKIRMARELWAAENGEQLYLENVPSHLLMTWGEQCLFVEQSLLHQRRLPKSGATQHFETSYGSRNPFLDTLPDYQSVDQAPALGDGVLAITTKRLIFDYLEHMITVSFNRVIDVRPLSDGIVVIISDGPEHLFRLPYLHAEYATLVLREVVSNQRHALFGSNFNQNPAGFGRNLNVFARPQISRPF